MSPNISLQRKFVSPEIVFGAGCRHSVGTCASNFGARKVLLVSTPTIRGLSRIEREYEVSDQRRYFVPCPHCGAM